MTTLAERIEAAHGWLRGFVGLFRRATFQCEHEWGDDEDFVSCYETTIGGLENGTHRPITIQTRQWCLKCDATRRKPGSARPAHLGGVRDGQSQAQEEARADHDHRPHA